VTDRSILAAAFNHLSQLELIYGDAVPSAEIKKGFTFESENVVFRSSQCGIFKPKQMDGLVLSITTTIPKEGSLNIYKDFEGDDGAYHYVFEKEEEIKGVGGIKN